jgi:predicted lipoprotein with Yx(FWY)xxD motif
MSKVRLFVLLMAVLLLAVPALAQEEAPPLVRVGESDLGPILIGPNGFTLYLYTRDSLDMSNCYERCIELWPPLLVGAADAELTMGAGVPGELGVIERTTGTFQVTYNGWPLYYWWRDWAPGQTTGQAVGEVWWVIPPATISMAANSEHGNILTGPNGMTVYTFSNDTEGTSACYDQCATNWPPVLVDSADALLAGFGVTGELGTTERTDGTLQVTYNGMPLYYFAADAARGDTTGHARGDVWWVVPAEAMAEATPAS